MTKPSKENFSQAEQIILREAKQDSAFSLLEKIKRLDVQRLLRMNAFYCKHWPK